MLWVGSPEILAGKEAANGTFNVQLLLCFRAGGAWEGKPSARVCFHVGVRRVLQWDRAGRDVALPVIVPLSPHTGHILNSKQEHGQDEGLRSQLCSTEHFPVSLPNALTEDFLAAAAAGMWNRLNKGSPASANWRVQKLINEIVQIYQ